MSSPVSIFLKWGASGNKPSLPWGGLKPVGTAPWGSMSISDSATWHECWASPAPTSSSLDPVTTARDKTQPTGSSPLRHGWPKCVVSAACRISMVFVVRSTYALIWHKALLNVVTRHRRRFHKCLRHRRHSAKKGCLRRQEINLAPLRRVRAWGDDPLRLREYVSVGRVTRIQATTPVCRGERYSIPRNAPLYPWSSPYSAECLSKAASSTIFLVFSMTRPGIEPWSPGPVANTLLIRPMARSHTKLVHTWKQICKLWILPQNF